METRIYLEKSNWGVVVALNERNYVVHSARRVAYLKLDEDICQFRSVECRAN